MARSVVAVLHTTPETYPDDLRRALVLAGAQRRLGSTGVRTVFVETGRRDRRPGSSTAPWTLDAVARRSSGGATAMGPAGRSTEADFERATLSGVIRARGLDLARPDDGFEEALGSHPPSPIWTGALGAIPRIDGRRKRTDALIVAPLRSCRRWGVRGAVDLALASLTDLYDLPSAGQGRDLCAELFTVFAQLHPWWLAVLDLSVCGAEDLRDRPSVQNLLVVSRDPVAADAVAARMLGIDPRHLPAHAALAERGLGAVDPGRIEVRGERVEAVRLGRLPRDLRPTGPLHRSPHWAREARDRWIRAWSRAITERPLRRQFQRTPWGRLLEDYRRGEFPWT